ncbi:MAG: hypothetical protein Q4G65_17045, partial [bacterium]|nr:hypothetical protein [bacterium]
DLKSLLKFLDGRKAGLLSPETRQLLLDGKYAEVSTAAAARLFSPAPPLFSVKGDPFLLGTDYAMSLQTNLSPGWSLKDGYPACEREGRHFLLQMLDLEGDVTAAVAQCRARAEDFNRTTTDDVRIWCSGPIFHTVHSTERAKMEINVLSCVSTILVAVLGWLLFRSLRFVPQLLVCIGAAFLVAAGTLFAVFPHPHVLTFVFGTSLIGLSVDYVYHARAAGDVRRILKQLSFSLLTTLACFSPLLFSEVGALRQMAVFTMAGLVAVYLCVLAWPSGGHPSESVPAKEKAGSGWSLPAWLVYGLTVLVILGTFRIEVASDPSTFYKPDGYLVEGERRFASLSPTDMSKIAYVQGNTLQECLEREESAGLRGLSAIIPSLKRQRENADLIARLYAREGGRYMGITGLKVPETPPKGEFLDAEQVERGGLKRVVDSFRTAKSGLVMPCPADFETRDPHVAVFEPRRVLQQIFDRFYLSTLKLLGISLAVLSVLLLALFRRDVLRYAGPLGWSIAATLGVLGWLGIPVTNFTLLCFFVMVGLGLDYVIFHRGSPTPETRRTVLFSFLSSLVGLGLLAFTEFPVTRSMGVTFASGLFFAYVFSRMGRDTAPPAETDSKVFEYVGNEAWHEQREQSAGRWRMQFMWCLYAWFGKGVQKLVTIPVMAFIYPFAAPARRALRGFYARLADFSAAHARLRSPSHLMLFRHLLGFAWSLADKTDACTLKKNLPKMTVRDDAGWQAFRDLVAAKKGAFLISTHLGTIEVFPALAESSNLNLSSSQPPLLSQPSPPSSPHVHAFQQMGHDSVFTKMFMKHFDGSKLTLHAVEEIGVETAVDMQAAIARGELVLMAGDRVSAGSTKTLQHDFLGCPCQWPKGVFTFAKLMESPVFFVTCVRTGWNAYECHFRMFDPQSGNRIVPMLDQYTEFLTSETLEYPEQWYQFYDFFMV